MSQSIKDGSAERKPKKPNINHLAWAIKSRHRNQASCLQLLKLFVDYEDRWKTKPNARIAQNLAAVAFSLWRSAFLADKESKREIVFAAAMEFLHKVVEDNTISYTQDKNGREWTFNYYTRNAQFHLEYLYEQNDGLIPEYLREPRSATERWDYCQDLLNSALIAIETRMADLTTRRDASRMKRELVADRKRRRQASRALTEPDRKRKSS